jgi:hypothetical protein
MLSGAAVVALPFGVGWSVGLRIIRRFGKLKQAEDWNNMGY